MVSVTEATPIIQLELSNRTKAALLRVPGMKTLEDVLTEGPIGIRRYSGIGRTAIFEIREVLRRNGLDQFFTDSKEQPPIKRNADAIPLVYFFLCEKAEAVKIGLSNLGGIEDRLSSIRVGNPYPVELIAFMVGNLDLEQHLHEKFRHLQLEGEWFQYQKEIRDYVESYTRRFNGNWIEISQSI